MTYYLALFSASIELIVSKFTSDLTIFAYYNNGLRVALNARIHLPLQKLAFQFPAFEQQ